MNLKVITVAALVAATALAPALTQAVGDFTPAPRGARVDADFEAGKAAIERQNWSAAIGYFNKVAARDPSNAGAQNWLGYANRKSGNLDLAFRHYNEALRLDPKHRGAHEYIGEAYLITGDVAKAKEHLTALGGICPSGCEEREDLSKAIAEYERNSAK